MSRTRSTMSALMSRLTVVTPARESRWGGDDSPPDCLRRERHVNVRDAERRQRVDHRIDDGGAGADRTSLARSLDAERVGGAGDVVEADIDRRDVVGARYGVIDERPAEELRRVAVVDGVLEQRLADPAHHLTLEQQRIDHRAE